MSIDFLPFLASINLNATLVSRRKKGVFERDKPIMEPKVEKSENLPKAGPTSAPIRMIRGGWFVSERSNSFSARPLMAPVKRLGDAGRIKIPEWR
jgi:hypothetical protein